MFRFIGFSWIETDGAQAAAARALGQSIETNSAWHLAFKMKGHRVYTTDAARGTNRAYPLSSNQGVVLGRLFRRRNCLPSEPVDFELADVEAQRIVQSDGRVLIREFWGRYVAFLPSRTGEGRVLRDPTGALPCFRMEVRGVSIVLSWIEDLLSLLDIPMPPVNWDALAAHMLSGRLDSRETALVGVAQVLAGELTHMTPRSSAPMQLWSAADHARRGLLPGPGNHARLLRETVVDCVQSWASCYEPFVLRLSGGVDSAILLGSLGISAPPRQITCLNYHSSGHDSDERHYARLAAQRAGATLIERELEAGFRLEEVLNVARTPTPANYIGGMGTNRIDAEVALSRQAGALFTGAGGDQLFFEFRCTWPAADYLRLRGVDLGFLETVLDAAQLGRVSFWKALQRAVLDRSSRGNPADCVARFSTLMTREAQDAARSTQRFVHPAWLAATDLPIGKFHQLGMLVSPFEYYDHYLREDSPELVHPLMSQPVLELCLALPTYILTQGGRGRALARTAFADHIPPEIAARRSKGGMDIHVAGVLQQNLPFAREMLLDGLLARQGLLDRHRVEAALAGRPSSTAVYVSEIHACIAAEAWLIRAAASSGQSQT